MTLTTKRTQAYECANCGALVPEMQVKARQGDWLILAVTRNPEQTELDRVFVCSLRCVKAAATNVVAALKAAGQVPASTPVTTE